MCIRDRASVEHRSDVLAQILHPEAWEVLESASAEFEPEKAEPVHMPTPQTEAVSYTHLDVYKRQFYSCPYHNNCNRKLQEEIEK